MREKGDPGALKKKTNWGRYDAIQKSTGNVGIFESRNTDRGGEGACRGAACIEQEGGGGDVKSPHGENFMGGGGGGGGENKNLGYRVSKKKNGTKPRSEKRDRHLDTSERKPSKGGKTKI